MAQNHSSHFPTGAAVIADMSYASPHKHIFMKLPHNLQRKEDKRLTFPAVLHLPLMMLIPNVA